MRRIQSKLIRVAPYLTLGPISGLLFDAIRINLRDDRPVLASLYGVVLAQYLVLLWWFADRLGSTGILPGWTLPW